MRRVDYLGISQSSSSASVNGEDQANMCHRGVKVVFVTSVFGSGVTLTIQSKDRASGVYSTLLAGAEVVSNTTNVYTVYPGLTADPNVTATNVLPETWRIKVAASSLAITVVNQGTKTFTVAGDQTALVLAASTIRVAGSTGNNGLYTVVSSAFDTDHTDIVVVQAIPDATADGTIVSAASYTAGCHLIP